MMPNKIYPRIQPVNADGWHNTQNDDYLRLLKYRIQNIELVWVKQILDLIDEHAAGMESKTIKDIGCQTFQFYKQLKSRGLPYKYIGYELEKKYVELGLKYFPELSKSVFICDFNKVKTPINTDISITSATLEHMDKWSYCIKKLISTTNNLILIRTFLGVGSERIYVQELGASEKYPIWQFDFLEFMDIFSKQGWSTRLIRDKYTDSLPILKVYGDEKTSVLRTQYILVATPNKSSDHFPPGHIK